MSNQVEQISENVYYLKGGQAIVTRTLDPIAEDIGNCINVSVSENTSIKIKQWGKKNEQPNQRESLIGENNIVPELLKTKLDITVGGELICFKKRFEGEKIIKDYQMIPPEIEEWLEASDFDTYRFSACKNLYVHANIFSEFVRDKGGRIASIKSLESRHTRCEKMDAKGVVNNYAWRGHWKPKASEVKDFPITTIPRYRKGQKQSKFVIHSGDDLLKPDEYYFSPAWWGGKNWIELANAIPEFHKANLTHGYTIRYHIQIPNGYFADSTSQALTPDDRKAAVGKEEAAKQVFLNKLNDFLAGIPQTGRSLYSSYNIDRATGKEFSGIKITPINVDLQDEALLKLFEKSNQANISAQGIHPTLASVETAGKLSSGSEMRNALLMYVATKVARPRRLVVNNILRFVGVENKWPRDLHFTIQDMEITTLDENKSGAQVTGQ